MHVDDGVDALVGAEADDAVEVGEPLGFEHPGCHVVFKVPVVDGDADAVEAERLEELCVGLGEEVLEELMVIVQIFNDKQYLADDGRWCGLTLSKKNSDFSLPRTLASASRSWNSHPG